MILTDLTQRIIELLISVNVNSTSSEHDLTINSIIFFMLIKSNSVTYELHILVNALELMLDYPNLKSINETLL